MIENKKPFLIYLILSFVILIPLLGFKHLFLLDFVPATNMYELNRIFYGLDIPEYGGILFFNLISSITPIEKFILFISIILSGCSMHFLIKKIIKSSNIPYYAGLLYMFNPYVYNLISAGQLYILFSYSIIPFLLYKFLELFKKELNEKKYIIEFVIITSIMAFNIHILIISLIILFLFLILTCFCEGNNKEIFTKRTKILFYSGILFFLLNSYWIIPLLTSKNGSIDNIGYKDFNVFSPRGDLLDVASMKGFWKEGNIYPSTEESQESQILYIIILILAIVGFLGYYRDSKIGIYVKYFGIVGIIGFILSTGINGPLGDQIKWLFENTILKGFRDSYKFVSMIVLSYSILGSLAIYKLNNNSNILIRLFVFLLTITPLLYSHDFFNGIYGQIKSNDYPSDWYQINKYLNNDPQDFKVLFFPWHMYMNFSWLNNTDKKIMNPSKYFFDKEIISGENIEAGQIYRQFSSPEQLYIDFLFKNRHDINNFGELISILDIKYVILTKESDYKRYKFLFNQTDLKLIKETNTLYLFENNHFVTKIYSVDNVYYIKNWNDLLERSKYEDITDKLYILDNTSSSLEKMEKGEKNTVKYEKINPVTFLLNNQTKETKKFIIFTECYSEDWRLDNKIPIKAYGVTNAYISNKTDYEIRFDRFYKINLPSYIISIATFITLGIIYFYDKRIFKKR